MDGSSVRTFTAPRILMDALRGHLDRYPPNGSGLVFTAPEGGPVNLNNWRNRYFNPAAERPGFNFDPYALRHVCASQMAASGASANAIAHRLGHANASITARVNVHLMRAEDERQAEAQDEAWAQ